jgi:hypothetical protein
MRIAQIAPLWERVPPPTDGAIKSVVGLLTDKLVTRYGEVVLFGSADVITSHKVDSDHHQIRQRDLDIKTNALQALL